MKKLHRSVKNKLIFGVCAGLGAYFKIDPILVRLIAVFLLFIFKWPVFLFYLVAMFIMPPDTETDAETDSEVVTETDSTDSTDSTASRASIEVKSTKKPEKIEMDSTSGDKSSSSKDKSRKRNKKVDLKKKEEGDKNLCAQAHSDEEFDSFFHK